MEKSLKDSQSAQKPASSQYERDEMNYFETELNRLEQMIQIPLVNRRQDDHREDPMEELLEVYKDVSEIEQNMGKSINIGNFIIQKHNAIFQELVDIQDELEEVDIERQTLEDQNNIYCDDIKQLQNDIRTLNRQNESLEDKVQEQVQKIQTQDADVAQLKEMNEDIRGTSIGRASLARQSFMAKADQYVEITVLEDVQILANARLEEINDQKEQFKKLEEEYDQEISKNEKLTADIRKLEQTYAKQKDISKRLQEKVTNLKDKNEELTDTAEVLQEEYDKLKNQNKNLLDNDQEKLFNEFAQRQSSVISRGFGSIVHKNTLTQNMNQFSGDYIREADVRIEIDDCDNQLQDNDVDRPSIHLRNDYQPGHFQDFRNEMMHKNSMVEGSFLENRSPYRESGASFIDQDDQQYDASMKYGAYYQDQANAFQYNQNDIQAVYEQSPYLKNFPKLSEQQSEKVRELVDLMADIDFFQYYFMEGVRPELKEQDQQTDIIRQRNYALQTDSRSIRCNGMQTESKKENESFTQTETKKMQEGFVQTEKEQIFEVDTQTDFMGQEIALQTEVMAQNSIECQTESIIEKVDASGKKREFRDYGMQTAPAKIPNRGFTGVTKKDGFQGGLNVSGMASLNQSIMIPKFQSQKPQMGALSSLQQSQYISAGTPLEKKVQLMDRGTNPESKGIRYFAESATQFESTLKFVDAQTTMQQIQLNDCATQMVLVELTDQEAQVQADTNENFTQVQVDQQDMQSQIDPPESLDQDIQVNMFEETQDSSVQTNIVNETKEMQIQTQPLQGKDQETQATVIPVEKECQDAQVGTEWRKPLLKGVLVQTEFTKTKTIEITIQTDISKKDLNDFIKQRRNLNAGVQTDLVPELQALKPGSRSRSRMSFAAGKRGQSFLGAGLNFRPMNLGGANDFAEVTVEDVEDPFVAVQQDLQKGLRNIRQSMAPRSKQISFLTPPNIEQVFSPVPEKVARATEAKKPKDQDEPTMEFPEDTLAERLRSVQESEEKDSRGTMYSKRSSQHDPVAKVQDALPSPISPAQKITNRSSISSSITSSITNPSAAEKSSHPECEFCLAQFQNQTEQKMNQLKKQMAKFIKSKFDDKEEEYFRMCLLSYQMKYSNNQKIMTLDYKSLYRQVTQDKKMPFYMWNNWLKDCIEKLNFEYIYKKKTEFEYAKILSQKYEVKDSYF